MPLVLPHDFVGGTLAQSAQVNANFSEVENYVNSFVMLKDGSTAFTGLPSLSGGCAVDPSSDNQLTRKLYVDRGPKVVSTMQVPAAQRTTSSTTYVDWPVGEVYSVSHTKRASSTQILVLFFGSAWKTVANTQGLWAVKVDAGADNDITLFTFNDPDDRRAVHGAVLLSGLGVGAHTYTLRAKQAGGGELRLNEGDRNYFVILEVN